MDTSKYKKILFELYLKGMIDEETLEEKMEEINRKEFEEDVNKAINEIKVEDYVKEAIKRIYSERFPKEQ